MVADPQGVVRGIEANLAPGAIVLMHEGAAHGHNLEGMALLLQRLDALGYRTLLPEELEVPARDPLIVAPTPTPTQAV